MQNTNNVAFSYNAPNANTLKIKILDPNTHTVIKSYNLKKQGQTFHQEIHVEDPNHLYLLEIDGKKCFDPFSKALTFSSNFKKPSQYYSQFTFDQHYYFESTKPQIKQKDLIIYEMHLRGFTQSPSSLVKHPGTFLGVIEKIEHLKSLGINAVQIMPLFAFDPTEHFKYNRNQPETLCNYWGYNTLSFFALMGHYATSNDRLSAINECCQMIDELHKAGIAVIFDVVYNHVSNQSGLDLLNKQEYFILKDGNHTNYSGCGNTINANSDVGKHLILESLRYFALNFNIDGFRFDLASSLTRDNNGTPLDKPPLITEIQEDPLLKDLILIAEPWDVGGLYQVQTFPGEKFLQHNGIFRDTLRKSIVCNEIQDNLSEQIKGAFDKAINFVTCHDGFTLMDLLSYNKKNNALNRENNQDGSDNNFSNDCKLDLNENQTDITILREKKALALLAITLFSKGASMLTMKDEYLHSHQGNNNAYCHDSDLNYFNWNQLQEKAQFTKKIKALINLKNQIQAEDPIKIHTCNHNLIDFEHGPIAVQINLADKPLKYNQQPLFISNTTKNTLNQFDTLITKSDTA